MRAQRAPAPQLAEPVAQRAQRVLVALLPAAGLPLAQSRTLLPLSAPPQLPPRIVASFLTN
ncbi:MAG: hypothetical protein OXG80_07870 [Chloroflexi bacterium]|nr:hypothetical protein [Chloroflexota bacterium]